MRYISLFSGIEAASVAWRGWEPVAFSEVAPFPCAVLAYRFPDVPNLGDVTGVDWSEVLERHGAVDLIVGGSPCQSFSVEGRREGLDGESGLMWEYIRAVRDVRPRWLLWENVPGVFSVDSGRAFGTLISELQAIGYGCAWRVFDSQFFGLAQQRKRVYVVGCLGEVGSAAAVLFERVCLSEDIGDVRGKREALAREAEGDPGAAICIAPQFSKRPGQQIPTIDWGVSYALTADKRPPRVLLDDDFVRKLTPLECERLQGFPDNWTDVPYKGKEHPSDTVRYRAIGNSFPVPVIRWIGERMLAVDRVKEEQ